MAYATAEDIESRLGRDLDESETTIVEQRLEDCELIILSRIPTLHTKVDAGTLNADVIAMVEADAVIRILRNPEGVVGETDGNYSYQLNWATVTGALSLTPHEWRLLGYTRSTFTIVPRLGSVPRYSTTANDALYGEDVDWVPIDLYPWITSG